MPEIWCWTRQSLDIWRAVPEETGDLHMEVKYDSAGNNSTNIGRPA